MTPETIIGYLQGPFGGFLILIALLLAKFVRFQYLIPAQEEG